jgi:hypothetical protein
MDTKETALRSAGPATAKELQLATSTQISFPPSNSLGPQEAMDESNGDKLADDDLDPLGDSLDDLSTGGLFLNCGDLAGFVV